MIKEIDTSTSNPFGRRIEYYEDDISLGFLEYSLIYDRIEIDNVQVNIESRGQGIGTKLMAYLVNEAINLRVINNEIAKNLYKKFGFREVALRKYYYGDEDGILMEKQIM